MAVANSLAYYDTATIMAVKYFIVQAPELVTASVSLGLAPALLSRLLDQNSVVKPDETFCLEQTI